MPTHYSASAGYQRRSVHPCRGIALSAALFVTTGLAHAGAQAVATTEPVVVTATRTARTADDSLASVQVITRAEIEQSQAIDVAELLRFFAGVDVARNGGPGQQTSVFIRGAESNHTLLLIDGVKVNTGTDGGVPWQNINPAMIERIEIVRGPRSTLYGSEAIGGVIQIFTRKSRAALTQGGAIGLGTNNTYTAEARIGAASDRWRGGMDLSFFSSDGFQTRTAATQDRGFDNFSFNLYADADLDAVDIGFSSWWTQGKTEYFDFFLTPLDQDFQNGVTALTFSATPLQQWSSTLKLSYSLDNISQNQSDDVTRTKRWAGDWQNDVQVGRYQLFTGGLYLAREETDSIVFGGGFRDKDKNVKAVFAQDQIEAGRHTLLLATRYTDDGFFGDKTTWNVAYGLRLGEADNLYASVGTGFKAPTSLDLFGFGGNPDLRAETSRNIELGARHRFGAGHSVELSAFRNTIDDLIMFFDPDGFLGPIPGQNQNIDRARISGVELQYQFAAGPWAGRLSLIRQNPEDRDSGEQLARRAKKSLTATASYRAGRYRLGGKLLATGERPDFAGSNNTLDAYALLDLNATAYVSKRLAVQGRLENVFDKDYETAGGFKAQGRALFVNLRFGDQ